MDNNNYLLGIDVSDVQGYIDWNKVKNSGVVYSFCKATEGKDFTAKSFKRNWSEIKKAGIIRGAYHYSHTKNDPIKEVEHFLNTVGPLDLGDVLALDIEDDKNVLPPKEFVNWVLTFLETIENKLNIITIVYTGGPYFDKNAGKPNDDIVKKLNKYPLWLAAYTQNPDKYIPYAWKEKGWTIWQRSGDVAAKGDTVLHVSGINVVVDRNQFRGTEDEFKKLFVHPKVAEPSQFELPLEEKDIIEVDSTWINIPVDITPPQPDIVEADVPFNLPPNFLEMILSFLKKLFK